MGIGGITPAMKLKMRVGPINSGGITHLLSVAWSTKTPGAISLQDLATKLNNVDKKWPREE